ncbi:MAG TPA: hypothetical protein VMR70_01000 [Flavisolibacter sp.]|nr:hypothetical protein [Flavisolibacter sp.]
MAAFESVVPAAVLLAVLAESPVSELDVAESAQETRAVEKRKAVAKAKIGLRIIFLFFRVTERRKKGWRMNTKKLYCEAFALRCAGITQQYRLLFSSTIPLIWISRL